MYYVVNKENEICFQHEDKGKCDAWIKEQKDAWNYRTVSEDEAWSI